MNSQSSMNILLTSVVLSAYLVGCSAGANSNHKAPAAETRSAPQPSPIETVTTTVAEALADFPEVIISDFAHSYPMVTAAEMFKRMDFRKNTDGISFWGIEGLSSDETLEIEVIYNTDLSLQEDSQGNVLESLPAAILSAVETRYPAAQIDEMASSTENGKTEYAVLFQLDGEELEVNLDSTGDFVSLENVLEDSEIPAVIRQVAEDQRVDMPLVEYEEVTYADDTVSYVVEFENDDGESISYKITSEGDILQIDFEGPL